MEQKALDYSFRFSEADLRDNQQGRLSEAQAALLRRDSLEIAGMICGALVIVVVLAILSAQPSPSELTVLVLIGLIPFAFTLGWFVLRTELAIQPRTVQALTGEVQLTHSPYSYSGMYRLTIGMTMLPLNRDQMYALRPGAYTVYYVPGLRKIVSAVAYSHILSERPEALPPSFERFDDGSQDTLRA